MRMLKQDQPPRMLVFWGIVIIFPLSVNAADVLDIGWGNQGKLIRAHQFRLPICVLVHSVQIRSNSTFFQSQFAEAVCSPVVGCQENPLLSIKRAPLCQLEDAGVFYSLVFRDAEPSFGSVSTVSRGVSANLGWVWASALLTRAFLSIHERSRIAFAGSVFEIKEWVSQLALDVSVQKILAAACNSSGFRTAHLLHKILGKKSWFFVCYVDQFLTFTNLKINNVRELSSNNPALQPLFSVVVDQDIGLAIPCQSHIFWIR